MDRKTPIPARTLDAFRRRVKKTGKEETARRLDCSLAYVYMLSHGRRHPGLLIALRIEQLFKIPPRAWFPRGASKVRP